MSDGKYAFEKSKIIQGDCLEKMKLIPDGSIDMIFADLPYKKIKLQWDAIIPFDRLWEQYERIIKDNGAIVLTAAQPFTSQLVLSNLKLFKYDIVWCKDKPTNVGNANRQHIRMHESVLVFYKKQPVYKQQREYFPRNSEGVKRLMDAKRTGYEFKRSGGNTFMSDKTGTNPKDMSEYNILNKVPHTLLSINSVRGNEKIAKHPTQKPKELVEYFIKTFTNEGDIVLDNVAGSGTTGDACINLNRDFILIEKEPNYYEVIKERVGKIFKNYGLDLQPLLNERM